MAPLVLDASRRNSWTHRLRAILVYGTTGGVPRRSLMVALIVGTILNIINQGNVLFGGGHLNLTKIILTFAVPYCVATYGAVSVRLSMAGANRAKPER